MLKLVNELFLWNYWLRVMHSFLKHIGHFFNCQSFLTPGCERDHATDM